MSTPPFTGEPVPADLPDWILALKPQAPDGTPPPAESVFLGLDAELASLSQQNPDDLAWLADTAEQTMSLLEKGQAAQIGTVSVPRRTSRQSEPEAESSFQPWSAEPGLPDTLTRPRSTPARRKRKAGINMQQMALLAALLFFILLVLIVAASFWLSSGGLPF